MHLRESFRLNERFATVVSHLLISLMMACFMISIAQFIRRIDPSWVSWYLPWVGFAVTLETMYSRRVTRRLSLLSPEWMLARGAELVVLLLSLRLLLYLVHDPGQLISDLRLWRQDFFVNFFSNEFVVVTVLVVFLWLVSGQFAEDLADLEGDEMLLEAEIPMGVSADRAMARKFMVDRIFIFGAIMVILASLTRTNIQSIWGERAPLQASALNLVLYFMLGLALLSLTQLSILRVGWSWERIPLGHNLASRWVFFGLVFLLFLAGLAVILPTRYSLGFLAILGHLLDLLVYILFSIWTLFLLLVTLLLSPFGLSQPPAENPPAEALTPPPPTPAILAAPAIPWFELLKSMLFWIIFLGVIFFSVYQYLNQHQELLAELRRLPGFKLFGTFWRWLIGWFQGVNRSLSGAVEAGLRRLKPAARERTGKDIFRFLQLKRLSPREKVLFYYLALVRRGKDIGIPRRPGQTPYEYEHTLEEAIPEVDADLSALTGAFVEARYSRHPVTLQQAGLVQRWWEGIRRALARLRKGRE